MKKFLLTIMAVGSMLTAYAQTPGTTPAQGTIDLDYTASDGSQPNLSGISSVKLKVEARLNRDCPGEVILKKNGKLLMAIPASNERRITIEPTGVEVLRPTRADDNAPEGNIWFTFYSNIKDSQAASPGSYQIVVPSGLYTTTEGVTNKAFVLNYTLIGGSALEVTPVLKPASGSSIESLSTITLTFQGATSISLKNKENVYILDPFSSGTGDETQSEVNDIYPDITISGNTAVLTLPTPISEKCNASLRVESGAFSITSPEGTADNESISAIYLVMGKQADDNGELTVSPAPGTYTQIDAVKADYENGGDFYSWFRIKVPEGATVTRNNTMAYIYLRDAAGNNVTARGYLQIKSLTGHDEVLICGATYDSAVGGFPYRKDTPMKMTPGSYYLYVPAGAFSYSLNGTTYQNKEMTVGPYVMETKAPEYTVSPASGEEIESLKTITVTFPEGSKMSWVVSDWATLTNEVSKVVYDIKPQMTENANGVPQISNVIVFDLPAEVSIPGNYVFTISSSSLKVDDAPVEVVANYTVKPNYIKQLTLIAGGDIIDTTFVPANNEDPEHWTASATFGADQKLEVTFELPLGYDALYYNDNSSMMNGMMTENYIPAADLTAPEAGFKLAPNQTIPVKAGENRITFTYGANGECATPTLLILKVDAISSGIQTIENAFDTPEFFTLQGVKVDKPEHGIYIKVCGGKANKVILK
ncbi:MAG: hypothetical protein NC328_00755 [Muribaculum sp.]|nr:hypothetical protein [Muribaculum sp.]